jgi:hypothetical protein
MILARMQSSSRLRRTANAGVIALAVAAAALTGPAASSANAASVAASPMTIAPGSLAIRLAGSINIAGGDVSTTWRTAAGEEVKAAGPAGSQVSLRAAGPNSAEASVAPSPTAPSMTPAQYAQSGRSVYWDALAAGVPKSEAVKMTLELGDRLPAAAGVAAPRIVTAGTVYNSVCVTTYGTYHFIFGTACLQQSYLERKPGAWYIENQIVTSGTTSVNGFYLLRLQSNYCYCNQYTYTRVGWSPSSTIDKGEPTSYSLSASYGPFSVSVQENQYPGSLSPLFPDGPTSPSFGSSWTGSANGTTTGGNYNYVDANSVAIIHDGHGTTNNANVAVGIGWN